MKSYKSPKIITIDIETVNKDGKLIPFLYCMYDGKNNYSFFSDKPDQLFDQLLRRKYRGYNIYAHNLSKFDIVYLFKYISNLSTNKGFKVDPIIKDGDIISIKISNRAKGINIILKDSYLLLEASLLQLSKAFDCSKIKGTEPILQYSDLLSENEKYYAQNTLHYNKEVELINNFNEWKELITTYCNNDCLILFEIITKFKELVWRNWRINIDDYPTFSSLSFAIFRTHYLEENTIPLTSGKVFDFIKESYTGGSTDMYIPYGTNINCYDVNSLYPYVMRENKFPIGPINEFEGDISILSLINQERDIYFIADVDITSKSDLIHPYLQIHHKINNNIRTIAPLGNWQMKIHSSEYFNSLKDYDITIKNGYFFNKGDLFSKFVDNLYHERSKYPKGSAMNYTCKLIMNSLYGRFGMHPITNKQEFVTLDRFKELTITNEIIDILDLGENGFFVTYKDENLINKDYKISIGIASAVTAYARVYMSKFKNNFKLFYSDTDSIFIDTDLPNILVGNEIGQFKLEYKFKEAIFLGPKIYAGITNDEKYICKIKGFKNSKLISFTDLKSLLNKDSKPLTLHHDKWFRSLIDSKITIKDQIYNLITTENKRELIYNNNIAINTKPFIIK